MTVDRHATQHKTRFSERTVYFCSAGWREAFEAEPARYT